MFTDLLEGCSRIWTGCWRSFGYYCCEADICLDIKLELFGISVSLLRHLDTIGYSYRPGMLS